MVFNTNTQKTFVFHLIMTFSCRNDEKEKDKDKNKKIERSKKRQKTTSDVQENFNGHTTSFFFLIDERIDVDRLFLKKLITDRSIFGLEQLYRDTNYFIYIKLITF